METLTVQGGKRLAGSIGVEGAKNAVLPIIAASLLTSEDVRISNVPVLEDVRTMVALVEFIGAKICLDQASLYIRADAVSRAEVPGALGAKIRCSILLVGALLPRLGRVKLPLPGGCAIGTRRIDLHLSALSLLGAKIGMVNGYLVAEAEKLKGTEITLRFPSVGATENIMIAACLAQGTTTISKAAKEPEIVDLAKFINSMGGYIVGAGTDTITILGVDRLSGTFHSVIPDRIQAGTYMVAAAITHGDVLVKGARVDHLHSVIERLREMGVATAATKEGLRVSATDEFHPVNIVTEIHPGFPTDMQPIVTPLLSLAKGQSTVRETSFDNRFTQVAGLQAMGAHIHVAGNTATITGVQRLKGAEVVATDIRAGAALIIAGLAASGQTVVSNIYEVDRGYERIEAKLAAIGARIERTSLDSM